MIGFMRGIRMPVLVIRMSAAVNTASKPWWK